MNSNLNNNPTENEYYSKHYQPDPEYLQCLTDMGIPRTRAKQALRTTGNSSLAVASSCALEIAGDAESEEEDVWADLEDYNYKMVFVVNASLSMPAGRIAEEVAHAAIGLYRTCLVEKAQECVKLACWEENSAEKKVVLSAIDGLQLSELGRNAKEMGISRHLVRESANDSNDSITVIGLFGVDDDLDKLTRHIRPL